MSLQTINQVLSPTNATYINGVSAERRFSAAVLKNLYQGLVEKDGRGVNDKWVSESDAEQSAQVFVNRILPVKMQPREQGASINGASFSANQHYTQTVTVGIDILTTLDDPIIIPRVSQDMIRVDLLAEQTEIYSNRLKTVLNGATAASKLYSVWKADNDGKDVNTVTISSSDVSNKIVLQRFVEGNSLLDEGDSDNGIDIFPEDTRICVVKPSYRATLKVAGVLVIGGANYAYDIARTGAVDAEGQTRRTEDGYIGEIDGVPCHVISNESLQHASEFLGLPAGELKASPFAGYISSSYANARGVSTAKQTKIVDAISGQGIVLQPYTKFGVASWYHKGNVILNASAYNPIKSLSSLFSSAISGVTFKVKAGGSRLWPTSANGVVFNSSTSVTATITALDDFAVDHLVAAQYVVTDTDVTTVAEFVAAATADGAVTGTLTSGTAVSLTTALTSGTSRFTVLAISDDGSVSLFSKKYTS